MSHAKREKPKVQGQWPQSLRQKDCDVTKPWKRSEFGSTKRASRKRRIPAGKEDRGQMNQEGGLADVLFL